MIEKARRIKVVQFIHGMVMGGAETVVKEYAIHLDKSRFDLTVLCVSRCDTPYDAILRDSDIDVEYISDMIEPWNVTGFFSLVKRKIQIYSKIRETLKRLNPDVIHYHLDLSCYLLFSSIPKTTRIFYTQHYPVENIKASSKMDFFFLERMSRRKNFQAIVLSEEMKKDFSRTFGTTRIPIVLRNGIDISRFQSVGKKTSNKLQFGIPSDAIVVGHIGRFSPEKNHLFLLDVVFEMRKRDQRVCLLMIGEGDQEETIRKKILSLGLADSVTILSRRKDVPFLLSLMDIFIFPSAYEGLGIVVIESQVSGVPCLVSDVLPSEVSISNKLFRLSLSDGPDTWANRAFEILDSEEPFKYREIERWDISSVVCDLEKIYEKSF